MAKYSLQQGTTYNKNMKTVLSKLMDFLLVILGITLALQGIERYPEVSFWENTALGILITIQPFIPKLGKTCTNIYIIILVIYVIALIITR